MGATGGDEFSGYAEGVVNLPLLHEPGERWRYGVRPSPIHDDLLLRTIRQALIGQELWLNVQVVYH